MLRGPAKCKLALIIAFFAFLIASARASAPEQARAKKEIMVEIGKVYAAMDQKMSIGVITTKFTDADYAEIAGQCDLLSRLANDYAKAEGKAELSEIAKSLATTADYLKQQVDRKDPVVTASTYGRVLSYCAECHYETRWSAGK